MSYIAAGIGSFKISDYGEVIKALQDKYEIESDDLDRILRDIGTGFCISDGDITFDGRYTEEDELELLETLAPFVEDTSIDMRGEDGSRWRFVIRNGCVTEENANLVYDFRSNKPVWIVATCVSCNDGIFVERVCGSVDDVRKYLAEMVKADRKKDKNNFDSGSVKIKDIEIKNDGSLYGYGCYMDYHIEYVAVQEVNLAVKDI